MSTIDEKNVPWFQTSLRYGLYAGLVSIIYGLISNLLGFSIPTSIGGSILMLLVVFAITVVFSVLAIRHHRADLGGFISFKRAFLVSFVALLISGVISTLWQLLYMNVIDPGFADEAMDKMETLLENFGLPEDQMDEQLEKSMEGFTSAGIIKQGLINGPIFSAVVSAIVGAIMKKKEPFA